MKVSVQDVIMKCMGLGLMVTINQRLDMDTIEMVADEFDLQVEKLDIYEPEVVKTPEVGWFEGITKTAYNEHKAVKESIKTPKASEKTITINTEDFQSFAQTMEKLISQHSEERQSFLQLVNTLQDRIFVLENQLNLLKAPQKNWYQFWK